MITTSARVRLISLSSARACSGLPNFGNLHADKQILEIGVGGAGGLADTPEVGLERPATRIRPRASSWERVRGTGK